MFKTPINISPNNVNHKTLVTVILDSSLRETPREVGIRLLQGFCYFIEKFSLYIPLLIIFISGVPHPLVYSTELTAGGKSFLELNNFLHGFDDALITAERM